MGALIRTIPTVLSRKQAQFYAAGTLLGLNALWDRNIIFRDLKPENIMIDNVGYPKIIDFGISKKLAGDEKTFTCVGTPHYMAPEVMRQKGYGLDVDLWSLGVMAFEFVCGQLPFADDADDPAEVCAVVLKGEFQFPDRYKDRDGRDFIGALLPKPQKRLGAARKTNDIWAHAYLK